MEEITLDTLQWSAPEYTHKEKSMDFLWTIGIVALIGVMVAIWKENYLFSVFILISGFCLVMFSIREPQEIQFSIDTKGLSLGRDNHEWKTIKGFDIKKGEVYGKLLIQTTKKFLPIYTVPFPIELREEIKETLLKVIPATELSESHSMVFMEKLGF